MSYLTLSTLLKGIQVIFYISSKNKIRTMIYLDGIVNRRIGYEQLKYFVELISKYEIFGDLYTLIEKLRD